MIVEVVEYIIQTIQNNGYTAYSDFIPSNETEDTFAIRLLGGSSVNASCGELYQNIPIDIYYRGIKDDRNQSLRNCEEIENVLNNTYYVDTGSETRIISINTTNKTAYNFYDRNERIHYRFTIEVKFSER